MAHRDTAEKMKTGRCSEYFFRPCDWEMYGTSRAYGRLSEWGQRAPCTEKRQNSEDGAGAAAGAYLGLSI
jgi:hypothetical protein